MALNRSAGSIGLRNRGIQSLSVMLALNVGIFFEVPLQTLNFNGLSFKWKIAVGPFFAFGDR